MRDQGVDEPSPELLAGDPVITEQLFSLKFSISPQVSLTASSVHLMSNLYMRFTICCKALILPSVAKHCVYHPLQSTAFTIRCKALFFFCRGFIEPDTIDLTNIKYCVGHS